MKGSWRTFAAVLCYVLGTIGWCYVGGYMILIRPVKGLVLAHLAGSLSLGRLAAALVEAFVYLSAAGGVWCIGYMLGNHFKGDR